MGVGRLIDAHVSTAIADAVADACVSTATADAVACASLSTYHVPGVSGFRTVVLRRFSFQKTTVLNTLLVLPKGAGLDNSLSLSHTQTRAHKRRDAFNIGNYSLPRKKVSGEVIP